MNFRQKIQLEYVLNLLGLKGLFLSFYEPNTFNKVQINFSNTPKMLWIKTLHIIFMVTWFAGLFYLPRLFVYHAMSKDKISHERFKVMERKLFFGIMTPGAFLTILFGVWLWGLYGVTEQWLQIKIGLVILLLAYHYLCFKHLIDFKNNKNKHSHIYFRWFNEVPVIALVAIIYLVEFKPA